MNSLLPTAPRVAERLLKDGAIGAPVMEKRPAATGWYEALAAAVSLSRISCSTRVGTRNGRSASSTLTLEAIHSVAPPVRLTTNSARSTHFSGGGQQGSDTCAEQMKGRTCV